MAHELFDPNKHEERCHARLIVGYEHLPIPQRPFCPYVAQPDLKYCRRHNHTSYLSRSLKRFPMAYRVLSKVLTRRLEGLNQATTDQLQLREELKLVRAITEDAVETYDQACIACELIEEQGIEDAAVIKKAKQIKEGAADALCSAIKQVRKTALDAARVEALGAHMFSAVAVQEILTQVVHIIHDACEPFANGPEIVKLIDERMREQIKVQQSAALGTMISPSDVDADVLEMDSTVPKLVLNG